MRCLRLAGTAADKLVSGLKAALEKHEVARVQVGLEEESVRTSVLLVWSLSAVAIPFIWSAKVRHDEAPRGSGNVAPQTAVAGA